MSVEYENCSSCGSMITSRSESDVHGLCVYCCRRMDDEIARASRERDWQRRDEEDEIRREREDRERRQQRDDW